MPTGMPTLQQIIDSPHALVPQGGHPTGHDTYKYFSGINGNGAVLVAIDDADVGNYENGCDTHTCNGWQHSWSGTPYGLIRVKPAADFSGPWWSDWGLCCVETTPSDWPVESIETVVLTLEALLAVA